MKKSILAVNILAILTICTSAIVNGYAKNRITVYLKNGTSYIYDASKLNETGFTTYDSNWNDAGKIVSNYFIVDEDSIDYFGLEEIDSVAFGADDEIIAKDGTVEITDEICQYIEKYDDITGAILFKDGTPDNLIPKKGDKIFSAKPNYMFPNGLCAEVVNISGANVEIEDLEPSEIFEKFVVTSGYDTEETSVDLDSENANETEEDKDSNEESASAPAQKTLKATIFDGQASYRYKAHVSLSSSHMTYDILKKNFSAKVTLKIDCEYNIDYVHSTPKNITLASGNIIHVPLKFSKESKESWYNPTLDMALIFKIKTEDINLKMKGKRSYETSFYYAVEDGDTLIYSPAINSTDNEPEAEFLNDSYINGSVSLMANYYLYIHPFLHKKGIKATISTGPTINGTIGEAKLDNMTAKFQASDYENSYLGLKYASSISGATTEYEGHKIVNTTNFPYTYKKLAKALDDGKYYMLPQFYDLTLEEGDKALDFNANTTSKLVNDIKIGACLYRKADNRAKEKKDFVASFYKRSLSEQKLSTNFAYDGELNNATKKDYEARPIINYAGREIIGPDAVAPTCDYNGEDHPHTVDLGLPSGTKWTCTNIGANKPQEYGNYYSGDDIYNAMKNLGEGYGVPSYKQIRELIDHTRQKWTTIGSTEGMLFIGNNGKSIFFPAASSYWMDNKDKPKKGWTINDEGSGAYWTSTTAGSLSYNYFMEFDEEDGAFTGDRKKSGNKMPIRAVYVGK
ncbi:MAG: hypothetical protein NC548_49430 [Lachnospiraceae bacterium]|nr:hypothetical protein [Lachnospiraceae bacterium]